jgi:hypothetical protein
MASIFENLEKYLWLKMGNILLILKSCRRADIIIGRERELFQYAPSGLRKPLKPLSDCF